MYKTSITNCHFMMDVHVGPHLHVLQTFENHKLSLVDK